MKASRLPLFCFALALSLTACDAVTGPEAAGGEAANAQQRPASPSLGAPHSAGAVGVALCHSTESGSFGRKGYERIVVAPEDVKAHLLHGDERAGGEVLDRDCRPVSAPAATCPCYAADDLAGTLAGAAPQPYVFFDVYNFYHEDERRTEARATLATEFGLFEEVAAVYITSTGDPEAPLAPLCFRQDVVADDAGDPAYTYETLALTIAEAEACRSELYAYAEAEGQDCEGGACGLPYTEEHLDPDFPPYHDEGFRTPTPVLDALRARIEAVRERLVLPA